MNAAAAPVRPAGYILVGGQSRRMGADKARLVVDGRTLLEHIGAEMTAAGVPVTLVGGNAYGDLGYPSLADAVAGMGPAGGVLTALRLGSEWNLVVACDMPAVDRTVFAELIAEAAQTGADCVIPDAAGTGEQPLCGLYHARCLAEWERAVASGMRRIRDIVARLRVSRVFISDPAVLRNVNTPAEWEDYLRHGR